MRGRINSDIRVLRTRTALGVFISALVGIRANRLRARITFDVVANAHVGCGGNCRAVILQMQIFITAGNTCKLRIAENRVCSESRYRNLVGILGGTAFVENQVEIFTR